MKLTTILTLGAIVLATPALAAAATDNASAGSQTAMNDTSAASSSGATIVSSVPDTQKPYKDISRASDFQKEAATTKQLNQQIASANDNATAQQQ
jgi:hypothetical protein